MNFKNSMLPIVVGISLAGGVAIGMLYLLFKKDEDGESLGRKRAPLGAVTTKRATTINVSIAKDVVGIVIGRGGANIREIQERTKTKINFKDEVEGDSHRTCYITGTAESAQLAESLIHNIIRNQPLITTSDITVPVRACGRIIGRNGENIRAITQKSGAKVTVDNSGGTKDSKFGDRRITLKGTAEQIAVAKSLIEEKVEEDSNLRQKCVAAASIRTPRGNKSPQYIMPAGQNQSGQQDYHDSRLNPANSDRLMEVYVSAVETPDRFWVQIVSPSSVELDQLLEQMTEYYSKDENKELHVIADLEIGQHVAAPFHSDGKWYRAMVVSCDPDDYAPEKTLVELYYVDYGDSYDVQRNVVLELRADFLTLPFQGIECSLAKVKPSEGSDWSEEATDLFEVLTYNAQWKVMMCGVDHYDSDKKRRQDRGRREGSPVPVVNLFDISGAKDINVADELVKNKFAKYIHPKKSDNPLEKNDAFSKGEVKPKGFTTSNIRVKDGSGASTSGAVATSPTQVSSSVADDTSMVTDAISTATVVSTIVSPNSGTDAYPTRAAAAYSSRVPTEVVRSRVDNGSEDASMNGHSQHGSTSTGEINGVKTNGVEKSKLEKKVVERPVLDNNTVFKRVNTYELDEDFELY